jgi:hypothetical protein
MTANRIVYFGRQTASDFQQHGDSCQPVLAGTASLWCGIHQDEAASLGFVSGMGYGNIQNQRAYSPPLAVNTPADAVDISFIYFQDSEPQYDYTFVQLLCFDAAGAPVDTIPIATFDGLAGTAATPILFDQGIEVPSGSLPPTTATIKLSFRFVSDMLVSDEDGLLATSCGPFGADNISIKVGTTDHYYDFEADAGGWTFDTGSAVGSYMGVAAQGVWQDWLSAVGIATCSLSGNALEMVDQAGSPYSPPGHPPDQYEYAISGVIARGLSTGSVAHVTWSQYADMPGEQATSYGVDYMYYPYTTPANPTPRWSPLGSRLYSSFYVSPTATCGDMVLDLTMPATWDSMRITYYLYNSCSNPGTDPCLHGGDTHGSPVIDNVRVGFFLPLVGGAVYPINGVENSPVSFASLTSAIARIRAAGVTGSGQVILELSPGYLGEPGPVWIPRIIGLPTICGVTIRPALGYTAVSEVAGASDRPYAIYITGSRITLDGRAGGVGTGRDWTIRCTGSGASGHGQSAVRVSGTSTALTNVVVRNCVLEAEAANDTSAVLALTGDATHAVTNVTFEGNLIRSAGSEATNCRGYALDVSGAAKSTNSGLVIRNNVVNQFAYGGISLGSACFPGAQIYGNDIFHTAPVTQPSATTFFGIAFNSTMMADAVIRDNFVHDIQLTDGSPWVSGLYLASGNSSGNRVLIYNNRVSIGAGIQSTEVPIYGVYEATGTSGGLFDLDYNSVCIGGSPGSGATNSAAFYNAATANAVLNVRNNIFCNARSNGGTATGTHWGIATTGSACLAVLNYNDYYAGGIGGVLGTADGSTLGNRTTLAEWRTALPGDSQSVTQNPHYLAAAATPPVLTINPAVPTQLESGGTAVGGIDTDFEGDIRQGSAGYGGMGYAPDIGADEFSGVTAQEGACCASAGTCALALQAACQPPSSWLGAETTCEPNPCPQPEGSCCQADGTCTVTIETGCTGIWTVGGVCDPNPCVQPDGTCCQPNGSCTLTKLTACAQPSIWAMFGVCEPNICPQPTGACCNTFGSCAMTTEAGCLGTWSTGLVCIPNPCPQPGQGPNTGGVLLVHDTGIVFTHGQTVFPSTPPASCTEADVEAPLVDSPSYPARRVWKVYAAFPPENSPRLKAVSWGITMTSDQGGLIQVSGSGLPDPETDSAVEQSGWPSQSGSGIVETLGSAQTTSVVELYWFGGFGYGGPYVAAQLFAAAPHPTEETYFADDAVPENRNPILAFGTLGFGVPGSSPCPGAPGSCCRADSTCAMTTEATCSGTWTLNGVCGPDPCWQATGACCDPAGSCAVTTETNCHDTWVMAAGCNPNPCPQPPGAGRSAVAWGDSSKGQCNIPSPNSGFVAVAGGWTHSLGLKSNGSIVAWGSNEYGQCEIPSPNTGFVAIAAGTHSLGLKADGSIVAWGSWNPRTSDVPWPNSDFVAMAAGSEHSLGLKSDSSIVAWGQDYANQCEVPAPDSGFIAVAAGALHSLGLRSDGTIVAWGANNVGQCSVPAPNSDFVAIAAGGMNSLGLKSDGTVIAWGWNNYGQCNVPAPNAGFVAIAAGDHSLGLKSDGTIVAWGRNSYGECNIPSPNSGFAVVAGGFFHSLGLKGPLLEWGACCESVGVCIYTSQDSCLTPAVWQGGGSQCQPDPCSGACCEPAGLCTVVPVGSCSGTSTWQGPGTICNPNPCPPPPPSNLAAAVIGRVKVRFSWECPGCNADGYVIERRPGSSLVWGSQGAVDAQSFAYNDVVPNTGLTWWYRVRSYNEGGMSPYPDPVCTYVGTLAVSVASHNLQPTLPRIRVGEKFLATFGLSNRELDPVAVDLRLAYRSQSGATGDLIGLLSSAVIDTGATSISTMIQIPSGMAPGMYDLDWRVYAAGTHDLLASLCSYAPGGLEILPGLPGARLALSPPTLSYVGCSVEDSFRDGDVIISNVGTAPLNVDAVRLDGDPAPACSGSGVFCLRQAFVPFVVQPGDTTTFGIRFRPNSVGVHEAVLTFDTNDPTGGSRTVTLRGEGTAPGVPVLSIWGDARVKSEPGESTPPVANQKATLYLDVWNSGTAPFVGDLRIDLAVWDLPGVGTTDGYWVSQEAAAGRREVAKFLAADNPDLGFSLEAGGKRTVVLRHPAVDGDSASMRFFSSHFSDLLDLTMTTSAGSVTHKYQNLGIAADPDADAGCLSELASVDRAPDSLDCPIGLYMVAERMVTAAAARNGSEMGLLLWDMTCSMIECAGQSATWGEVLDACDAAIDTWESESNGNGCGHAVATYGPSIASGLAEAAEAAWVPGSGEGAGAYVVITAPPGSLKVNGRTLLLTSMALSTASRADSVRVIEVGPGRLIYIPESLLGLTQLSGFGDLSIGLTVDLLSADGVKTSASYPELPTGPGTVIALDLSDPGDPFLLSVDDNGDGTIDRTVESTAQTTVDVMPPSPVRDLDAIVSWTLVTLQWTDPPEADFDSLLVRASTSGFPATPTIGRKAFGASGLFPNETLRFSEDLGANGTWFYSFFSVDSAGNASSPETLRVLVNAPLQVEEPAGRGQWPTRIWSILPNPSRSTMTIRYSVATDRPVSIEVFDPLGRRLAHLMDQAARAGSHSVVWDGRDSNGVPVVSGVYLVRLSSGGRSDSRRVVLLR